MVFEIEFENDPNLGATAAAQEVVVTDPNPAGASTMLDDALDLTTLQFTSFGFGPFRFVVPPGLSNYETTIDLRPDGINLLVPVKLELNQETRVLKATFRSLDPLTGLPPDDVDAGFLPVNDKTLHNGEGFFTYLVSPKVGLPTGTEITNQGSIVFDVNAPILTPTTRNTIDAGGPTSSVAPLPAQAPAEDFTVSWSSSDEAGGSGVASVDVFVADNGGPFELFLGNASPSGQALFPGEQLHTYAFFSVATDNVGHTQVRPTGAGPDATTQVTDLTGPTIQTMEVTRDAKGKKVTSIVLTFSEDLSAAGAETLANYALASVKGTKIKPVLLTSAEYDAAARAVTLTPRKALSVKKLASYRLTVRGDAGSTLTDASASLNPLDGDRNGTPGGDFVRSLSQGAILSVVDELLESGELSGRHRLSESVESSLAWLVDLPRRTVQR